MSGQNNKPPDTVSRRRFMQFAVGGIVLGTVGGAAWHLQRRGSSARLENPFSLDLSRFYEIDPALVHFRSVRQFPVPRPDARRVALDLEGRLHVAAGRYVVVLDAEGNRIEELACAAPARCVAVAEDGSRFVGFSDHVEVFNRRGQRQAAWDPVDGRPFLTGLSLDANHLFVADSGNRVIWRHDRSGKLLGRIGERDPSRNVAGLILPSPHLDVVMAKDGLLRVNNPGRHRVEAYTLDGHLEFFWGRASAAIDGFCGCCNPVAIESMPDGRTVTFEKGIPRVKIYSATGEFESVVAGPGSFQNRAGQEATQGVDASMSGLDGVADGSGRLYVLDPIAQRLQRFEPVDPAIMPHGQTST
jgi:hypothetical protein